MYNIKQVATEKPLVSIIITSYNRAHFIDEAIRSALAQDYENFEIIISDNSSTDNTDDIVNKYISDPKIKYFKNEVNIGMIPNFKIATEERARGEFIVYLSSDDYFVNNRFISQSVDIITKYKEIFLVFGRVQTILGDAIWENKKTFPLYKTEYKKGTEVFLNFPNKASFGWGAALINRKELNSLNIFRSKATSVDYEANLILMLRGNVGFINEASYMFRIHDSQCSGSKDVETLAENLNYILTPFNYALKHNILPLGDLIRFRDQLLLEECRRISLRFLALDKKKYVDFMRNIKANYRSVYYRLIFSAKWNILNFFYRTPSISLNLIKRINNYHYIFLKSIR